MLRVIQGVSFLEGDLGLANLNFMSESNFAGSFGRDAVPHDHEADTRTPLDFLLEESGASSMLPESNFNGLYNFNSPSHSFSIPQDFSFPHASPSDQQE